MVFVSDKWFLFETTLKIKVCRTVWSIIRLELEFSRQTAEPFEVFALESDFLYSQLIKNDQFRSFLIKYAKKNDNFPILKFKFAGTFSKNNFPNETGQLFSSSEYIENYSSGTLNKDCKKKHVFYGDSYQNPTWMYPNVQIQLDGSRLETVNNQVVQQIQNLVNFFAFVLH